MNVGEVGFIIPTKTHFMALSPW